MIRNDVLNFKLKMSAGETTLSRRSNNSQQKLTVDMYLFFQEKITRFIQSVISASTVPSKLFTKHFHRFSSIHFPNAQIKNYCSHNLCSEAFRLNGFNIFRIYNICCRIFPPVKQYELHVNSAADSSPHRTPRKICPIEFIESRLRNRKQHKHSSLLR